MARNLRYKHRASRQDRGHIRHFLKQLSRSRCRFKWLLPCLFPFHSLSQTLPTDAQGTCESVLELELLNCPELLNCLYMNPLALGQKILKKKCFCKEEVIDGLWRLGRTHCYSVTPYKQYKGTSRLSADCTSSGQPTG